MSGGANRRRATALAAGAIGLALAAGAAPARASLIGGTLDADFSLQPATLTIGTSSFIFSAWPGEPPAAVRTTGSAEVSSLFGGIADFRAGATIDQAGELYTFAAFPVPTAIPYSAADDFIGLAFRLGGSEHFGYAEVAGTELISYAYDTQPDTSVVTGAVPEPATIAVLSTGLFGLALANLRRRRARAGRESGAISAR